jgi:ribose transport system ATP-binding protein
MVIRRWCLTGGEFLSAAAKTLCSRYNSPMQIELKHIHKHFGKVHANNDITLTFRGGRITGILGENGAGKSTLMKILSGALLKDSGVLAIDGREIELHSPIDAQRLGISIIYQDFKLVPELSVAENIFLGSEPTIGRLPFIDFRTMHERARSALAQLGEEIDTHALIRSLSVAQRQMVEIAKALSRQIRIIAMDEPSAALTERELQNLFAIIRRLKHENVGVIYISHRLEEIFQIGDRVTVLRDGKVITTCEIKDADRRSLIRWMVGRELENEYPKIELQRGKEILRVENLSAGILHNVNLSLHQGEILGLAGLVGAGRSELAQVIFGANPKDSGKIFLENSEINLRSPRTAINLGIGLLTEDRNRYGLVMQMGVRENISLANLRALCAGPFINKKREIESAQKYVDELRIKTPSLEQRVENLSGGNRQKVVLARWLFTKSKVLIFDEPTAGVDVGVKYEIYNLINQLAKEGIGVLVISSDLPELLGICDRIAVMCEGRLAGIVSREQATQEKIIMLATGVEEHAHRAN